MRGWHRARAVPNPTLALAVTLTLTLTLTPKPGAGGTAPAQSLGAEHSQPFHAYVMGIPNPLEP